MSTGWQVSLIEHSEDLALVRAVDGRMERGRQVILALPPMSAHRIVFSPDLPRNRRQIQMRTPMGRFSEILVRYESPFWEEADLSGCVTDSDEIGAVVFPGTKEGKTCGTLIGFIGGGAQDAFSRLSPELRRSRYLEFLAHVFGDRAKRPRYYHETDWTMHAWAQGGPVAYMGPGVLGSFGRALRAPFGSILFAGTEAAADWTGYMEGAVRSGFCAADAALERIRERR